MHTLVSVGPSQPGQARHLQFPLRYDSGWETVLSELWGSYGREYEDHCLVRWGVHVFW